MKIAVVHNLALGGAHRRLRSQLEALKGHELLEITLSTGVPVTHGGVVVPLRRLAPTRSKWARPPLRYLDLASLLQAWKQVALVVNAFDPDVCYLNPCQFLQTPTISTRVNAPVVYYCDEPRRDFSDPHLGDTFNPSTKWLYYVLRRMESSSERRHAIAAARVATNSNYTAALIGRALGVDSELVRCGVATSFAPQSTRTPEHVLSVGTLIPSKGHDVAIESLARSRVDLPLIVVSPRVGEATEQARLKQLASRLRVDLTLLVGIPEAELSDLYGRALATLYLAKGEPFGLASLEAQACGCPVIVADQGGLPETIDPGKSGWCVPREPDAAAEALDRLLDGEVRRPMVAYAPAWAAEFTWEKSAESLESLFAAVT